MTSPPKHKESVATKMAIGYLFRKLKTLTQDEVHEHIAADKPLLENLNDSDWSRWRDFAIKYGIGDITMERVVETFRKKRLDLLMVVMNTPNGMAWLEKQLKILRSNLGLE